MTPLSETLGPGEETTVLLSARPGATSTAGVRAGRVVATWPGGSVSTPVAMAVSSGAVGGARVVVSPAEVFLLVPESQATVTAEVVVTNPGAVTRPSRPDDRAGWRLALRLERGPRVADPSRRNATPASHGRPEVEDARGRRRPGAHRPLPGCGRGRRGRPGRRPRRRRGAGSPGRGAGSRTRPARHFVLGRPDRGPERRGSRAGLHVVARAPKPRGLSGLGRRLRRALGIGRRSRGRPCRRDGPGGRHGSSSTRRSRSSSARRTVQRTSRSGAPRRSRSGAS